jgi:hypothetical protein
MEKTERQGRGGERDRSRWGLGERWMQVKRRLDGEMRRAAAGLGEEKRELIGGDARGELGFDHGLLRCSFYTTQ